MHIIRTVLIAAIGLALSACQTAPVPESGTAYLVRHAEKVTGDGLMQIEDPRDPPLTKLGQVRAQALADRLANAGVVEIWSTDTTRTRDTAAPLAARLGLEVQLYDPFDLTGFAAQLRAAPATTVLVVGHSNTTPQLAEALGAAAGEPIVEKTEYDRLYVIDLGSGQGVIERFGVAAVTPDPND